jgi:hypothetical protein
VRTVVDPTTGEVVPTLPSRPPEPLDPGQISDIAERILRYTQELEDALPDLDAATSAAADAEADWLEARARAVIAVADEHPSLTVGERDARADVVAADARRAFLIAREAVKAKREYLHSLRAQLSACQTLARLLGEVA